jgi:hypothetical protein
MNSLVWWAGGERGGAKWENLHFIKFPINLFFRHSQTIILPFSPPPRLENTFCVSM